jgi:ferric-dicitrate binding protein FerR (iron transport regulator)
MQEKNIDEVIRLVLTGEASREEITFLNKWLQQSEENKQVFHQLQMIWNERAKEPQLWNADQISERIWEEALLRREEPLLERQKAPASHYLYYIKVAAIILIIVGLPLLIFTYTSMEEYTKQEATLIEKKSTIGQKIKIHLPDGSLVWLNADSRIWFDDKFEGNTRLIILEGEAFFEVKKDIHKPFIVRAGKTSTTAVGTSFNISAYPEDSTIQVALITGKVQVLSPKAATTDTAFILQDGKGLNYHKYLNYSREFQFDGSAVLAWKQGILLFEADSFEAVKSKLRRWYGIDVTVTGIPPDDWKLTGRFRNEPLTSVLENIRFGRNFSYHLAGKQLHLHFESTKP